MKNVHRLSLMVLTLLTAAFLVVDLPLMAQMGGQQRRGQQRAPQQQKGAQQGAPRGAGTAQIDKSSPKLTPQQQQRVGQLRQQAQSLFRNLKQVRDQLQGLKVTTNTDKSSPPLQQGERRGDQIPPVDLSVPQKPGQQRGTNGTSNNIAILNTAEGGLASSNPSEGVVGDEVVIAGGKTCNVCIKFDGLKKQAQQIVKKFQDMGNELKALGFTLDGKGTDIGKALDHLVVLEGFDPENPDPAHAATAVFSTIDRLDKALSQIFKELEEWVAKEHY